MSRPRALTDNECLQLAEWFNSRRTIREKARELGISVSALYDNIARGNKQQTAGEKQKIAEYLREIEGVPRESKQSEHIGG